MYIIHSKMEQRQSDELRNKYELTINMVANPLELKRNKSALMADGIQAGPYLANSRFTTQVLLEFVSEGHLNLQWLKKKNINRGTQHNLPGGPGGPSRIPAGISFPLTVVIPRSPFCPFSPWRGAMAGQLGFGRGMRGSREGINCKAD